MKSILLLLSGALLIPISSLGGPVLEKVLAKQTVTCGINRDPIEYSKADGHGNRAQFDADLCTAVASAVLGSHAKALLTAFGDEPESLNALKKGDVVLVPTATPDFSNMLDERLSFGHPIFYDAQTFIVAKNSRIKTLADLKGKGICYVDQTSVSDNMHDYAVRANLDYRPVPFQEEGEMEAAFITNNCQAISGDFTQLANMRQAFRRLSDNFEILSETIAPDPLAPVFASGDREWANIVQWTFQALLLAEDYGITRANVDSKLKSEEYRVQRLLGLTKDVGRRLKLSDDWALNAIRSVGNYGEMYDRDLGMGSPLKIPRGPNQLDTHGGLLYPLPLRIDPWHVW